MVATSWQGHFSLSFPSHFASICYVDVARHRDSALLLSMGGLSRRKILLPETLSPVVRWGIVAMHIGACFPIFRLITVAPLTNDYGWPREDIAMRSRLRPSLLWQFLLLWDHDLWYLMPIVCVARCMNICLAAISTFNYDGAPSFR